MMGIGATISVNSRPAPVVEPEVLPAPEPPPPAPEPEPPPPEPEPEPGIVQRATSYLREKLGL